MADVFLSYARHDEAVAGRVAKALESSGLDVWWDAELPAHRAYSEVITSNLESSAAVVVLWSSTAAKSQWVRAEADFARNAGKLVQARIDDSFPPLPFNQIQCADLNRWRGGAAHPGWAKLQSSIATLVSGEEQRPAPKQRNRFEDSLRPYRWWIAAAVAAIIAAAAISFVLTRPSNDQKPVLAVLPFESLDSRDASLVAGMWEDTRQALGRNPQLLVLGPNSSEELAKKDSGAARKAADYLLNASIRRAGDRIRVSTNLTRTNDGTQIWSDSFERKLDDVFALESQIASEIEGRIRGRLAKGGGVKPENIATSGEVYALYNDARVKVRTLKYDAVTEAYDELRQIVKMDPNFAPAWATLAVAKQFGVNKRIDPNDTAEADARRAIALAPNLAAGHAALGLILGEGPASESELRRAIELDPGDVEALQWLADSLDPQTRSNDILTLYSKIVEIEPLWWPAMHTRLSLLFRSGDTGAVEEELTRVERLGDRRLTTAIKIVLLWYRGDLSSAVKTGLAYDRQAGPKDRELVATLIWQPLMQLGYFELADKLATPSFDYIPYIRRNDPHALDMIEAELTPQQFWTFGELASVGSKVYLLNGQGPRLAKQYRAAASSAEEFKALVGKYRLVEVAPAAALALRSVGDEAQARRLLELAEEEALKGPRANVDQRVLLARIYAVEGRTDEGISMLWSVVRTGWLPPYVPINTDIALDPPLNELRTDPRFEQMRRLILSAIRRERAELGSISLS
ncbi:MAG TPA: TIR domain-containing protein [Sphingomicrobium sp.]|nr:TIR domain-containing protein [Sphingomicrobium sp.]